MSHSQAMRERRQVWVDKLHNPAESDRVIAYLKRLKGIPEDQPLPNGTPIVTEIIRLEDEAARKNQASKAGSAGT